MTVNLKGAEIITVGNELLMGHTVNTNAAYLAAGLQKLGFSVKHQQTVADDEQDIMTALRAAVSRSAVVILTGGLGPTDDDLTKETVAKALGLTLILNDDVLKDIRAFFESRGREMADNNIKQAMVPNGAVVLKNENGTAPGLFIGNRKQAIILLPGPPYEMRPLFDTKVAPVLAKMSGSCVKTATLGVTGIGESELETKIKDLLYGENPHSALYAKDGEVSICITAFGEDEEETQKLIDDKKQAIRDVIGDNIYTEEGLSLSEAVVKQLKEHQKMVALAESCTGGMMAQQITAVPGSSAVFQYGLASYSDWVKNSSLDVERSLLRSYTAVSSQVAGEMARGARRNGKADYGVGITGLAGPGVSDYFDKPVGLVYISVCDKEKTYVKKFNFGNMRGRDNIRHLAVVNAFDMLRRLMNGLPIEGAVEVDKTRIADYEHPEKSKKRAGILFRKTLSLLLCLTLLGSMLSVGMSKTAAVVRKSAYSDLTKKYSSLILEKRSEGVAELTQYHPNCSGWLFNQAGDINTVTVYGRGDDYFTGRDFDGRKNQLGSCAVLENTDMTTTPDNLVIMSSCSVEGVMLGSLNKYLDLEYAKKNCWFLFCGSGFEQYYRLFSVYMLDDDEGINNVVYTSIFRQPSDVQQFIINAKIRSMYENNEPVCSSDHFLTLVSDMNGEYEGCKLVVVAKAEGAKAVAGAEMDLQKREAFLNTARWYMLNNKVSNVNVTAENDMWYEWILRNDSEEDGRENLLTPEEKHIAVLMNGERFEATPLEVVSRVVAAKLDDSYSTEGIKAVALATATQLKYEMLNAEPDTLVSVDGAPASEYITSAVFEVINKIIKYNGKIAWTPTFKCSSGHTNSALEYYGLDLPYLISVDSGYDHIVGSAYSQSKQYPVSVVKELIEDRYGIRLSEEDPSKWITFESVTEARYATKISVDGQMVVDAKEILCELLGLQSTCVQMTWYNDLLSLQCYGTGDNVGLSVIGANRYNVGMAWGYEQMINHYFPGTDIGAEYWDYYYSN